MSLDLIVKGRTPPDGTVAGIGVSGETIAAIASRLNAEAGRVVDAADAGCRRPSSTGTSTWMPTF